MVCAREGKNPDSRKHEDAQSAPSQTKRTNHCHLRAKEKILCHQKLLLHFISLISMRAVCAHISNRHTDRARTSIAQMSRLKANVMLCDFFFARCRRRCCCHFNHRKCRARF